MKRRNRVLLMWVLTGIWLCVQSPWAQSLRSVAHAHTVEHVAAQLAADPVADHCHGDVQLPATAKYSGCCTEGHCDGQCAQLSFTLATSAPRLTVRAVMLFAPMQIAGVQSARQPELFRPPI